MQWSAIYNWNIKSSYERRKLAFCATGCQLLLQYETYYVAYTVYVIQHCIFPAHRDYIWTVEHRKFICILGNMNWY